MDFFTRPGNTSVLFLFTLTLFSFLLTKLQKIRWDLVETKVKVEVKIKLQPSYHNKRCLGAAFTDPVKTKLERGRGEGSFGNPCLFLWNFADADPLSFPHPQYYLVFRECAIFIFSHLGQSLISVLLKTWFECFSLVCPGARLEKITSGW